MKSHWKIQIGLKLMFLFMATALITGFLGYLGITNMGKLNMMLTNMYGNTLVPIIDISDANLELRNHNRRLCIYVLLSEREEKDFFKKKMLESKTSVTKYVDLYRKTNLTIKEKDLLGQFDKIWPIYMSHAEKTLSLSQSGNKKDAETLAIGETRMTFQTTDDILANLVKINRDQGKKAYEESNYFYAKNRIYFIILIFVCVGITLGVGLLISVLIIVSTIDLK